MDNADAVLDAAKSRYQRGIGTVVEVAQATQNRAQTKLAMVQAQGAQTDSYLGVVTAIGISPLSKPRIAETPQRPFPPALRTSIEEIVESAIARRPDVLAAYALERSSQARVKAAEAEFLPKFFMSAFTSYASSGSSITAIPSVGQQAPTVNLNGNRYGASVFLGVTVPIYDGGLRSGVLAQARNDADSASAKLTRSRDESVRQIVVSQSALESSLAAYEAAQSLVAAAQVTYNAAYNAYRKGVGSVIEANLAQNQLLLAQNTSADAYSGALSAGAALALATGTAVAQVGLVAFVGLVAPHLVRGGVKTTHGWLVFLAALMGGALLLAADVLARWLLAPQELPVGGVTALLGGVYLLWLMHRRRL